MSEVVDKGSKEYIELKSKTIWENIQYLIHRKVDTNDDKYRQQFIKPGETGLDRIRLMWSEHLNGEDNPEVRFIFSSIGMGAMMGAFYGGIIGNRTAVQDFIRRHNEYVFRGEFEAKRKIHDSMFLQFGRQAWKWGWRVALFTGLMTGMVTTAIAYRDDVYYKDCVSAGGITCALWKAKLGMRAMVVSGAVGSILGCMFAGSIKLMLFAFNTSVPEYRHWRHVRYLGHLTVQKYSDGTTEYDWSIDGSKPETNTKPKT